MLGLPHYKYIPGIIYMAKWVWNSFSNWGHFHHMYSSLWRGELIISLFGLTSAEERNDQEEHGLLRSQTVSHILDDTSWLSGLAQTLTEGQKPQNTHAQTVWWKDLWGEKVIWHMFTRCVAIAVGCLKWWNPISFQVMFSLLILPRSASFVPRSLCPKKRILCPWCNGSGSLALLWHLSDASVQNLDLPLSTKNSVHREGNRSILYVTWGTEFTFSILAASWMTNSF